MTPSLSNDRPIPLWILRDVIDMLTSHELLSPDHTSPWTFLQLSLSIVSMSQDILFHYDSITLRVDIRPRYILPQEWPLIQLPIRFREEELCNARDVQHDEKAERDVDSWDTEELCRSGFGEAHGYSFYAELIAWWTWTGVEEDSVDGEIIGLLGSSAALTVGLCELDGGVGASIGEDVEENSWI